MNHRPSQPLKSEPDIVSATRKGCKLLKEARLRQGISLDAVQEGTKIPLDALKAIEEGYKVRSLSPFYYRGFMKMYAKYLGLDPVVVLEEDRPADEEMTVISAPPDQSAPAPVAPRSASEQEAEVPAWKEALQKFLNPQVIKGFLVGLVGLILLIAAARLTIAGVKAVGGWLTRKPPAQQSTVKRSKDPKTSKKKTSAKASPPTVEKTVEPAAVVESSVAPPPAAAEPVVEKKQVTMTVRAAKNSWFQVKADGQTVFQSTLRAGASESWVAQESLEVSGKNINQLEYEVNGRFLGALGRKDRQAKKLVITKDGMSVTK